MIGPFFLSSLAPLLTFLREVFTTFLEYFFVAVVARVAFAFNARLLVALTVPPLVTRSLLFPFPKPSADSSSSTVAAASVSASVSPSVSASVPSASTDADPGEPDPGERPAFVSLGSWSDRGAPTPA